MLVKLGKVFLARTLDYKAENRHRVREGELNLVPLTSECTL